MECASPTTRERRGAWRATTARGDKSAYTAKQKWQAERIEESDESRGVSHDEAERRAWATVNKESGDGVAKGAAVSGAILAGYGEHRLPALRVASHDP
jgi:hypothetical protein